MWILCSTLEQRQMFCRQKDNSSLQKKPQIMKLAAYVMRKRVLNGRGLCTVHHYWYTIWQRVSDPWATHAHMSLSKLIGSKANSCHVAFSCQTWKSSCQDAKECHVGSRDSPWAASCLLTFRTWPLPLCIYRWHSSIIDSYSILDATPHMSFGGLVWN